MTQENQLTRSEAIEYLANQLDAPLSLAEFTERVLSIWSSKAKNPQAGVRQDIRAHHQGSTLIFLDDKTIVPTYLGMTGVTFRLPLSAQEISKGLLYVSPNFQFLRPEALEIEDMQFVDTDDHVIPAEVTTDRKKVETIFGEVTQEIQAFRLGWWFKKRKIRQPDYLLVTILDWVAGKFRLEPQPGRDYRRFSSEVEASNRQLADMLFKMLEESRYESIWGKNAIPTAYTRLQTELTLPADHWLLVIENDSRMRWDGYEIRYAESLTFMESMITDLQQEKAISSPTPKKLSAKERAQVFRFKAYLKYQKGLWRRIEIQGGQDFKDFDDIMRAAFQHDFMDHLSGFWQRIRRGNSRRFREVELAKVGPFSEYDEGEDQLLARLKLKPGDVLKYVYDFGDWIEHYIELEAIDTPETDVVYPRTIAQNKPRYRYCPTCRDKGRKTIATHICLWCSNDAQEDILMCEDCITPAHEEHYIDDILY